jgi:hypothetical protein
MSQSSIAFKEWAVVCEALARGQQSLILRKGGIHEGRDGFRIAHDRFWLMPTKFHAAADALTPEGQSLLAAAEPMNVAGAFWIRHFAVVEKVIELHREEDTLALAGQHIWSQDTVRQRFHYKQPSLYCLVVRVFSAASATRIEETPQIAGCRSWVDLPEAISTNGLTPVMDEAAFQRLVPLH